MENKFMIGISVLFLIMLSTSMLRGAKIIEADPQPRKFTHIEQKESNMMNLSSNKKECEYEAHTSSEGHARKETKASLIDDYIHFAKCVKAEAGNQDELGQRLVIDVILNRAEASGMTTTEVINKAGQFEVVENGAIYRQEADEATIKMIDEELETRSDSAIQYFCSIYYIKGTTPAYKHGAHYFSI